MEYFIGTNELEYTIGEKSSSLPLINKMNNGQTWIFPNGTAVDGVLGYWDRYERGGTFNIEVHNKFLAGDHQTYLRGCTKQSEIIELKLDMKIKGNLLPRFEEKLQTKFEAIVGETVEYQIPKAVDPEGNDNPEVYIDTSESTEFEFPPYLYFSNITNTLKFRPHTDLFQGVNYIFDIIVKEAKSDRFERHSCSVMVPGDVIDPMLYYNYTDIEFAIKRFDVEGNGIF